MSNLNKINLTKRIKMADLTVPIYMLGKPYVRTAEDDKRDRAEREWKDELNKQARLAFLRRNPSGRINFN